MDRTALHAALADPNRLAIADALALGDLSPGALAAQLDLSTNLLAHHLQILEQAGVIARQRSEGDARRSYVSLLWTNPIVAATVAEAPALDAQRVVFVCTQNSARSQFAASLFARASDLPVASAGTRPANAIHPRAIAELHARGLAPITPTPAAWDQVASPGDLVVAVCDTAFEGLTSTSTPHLHWSVPDPATADAAHNFTEAFQAIEPRVERLAASLNSLTTGESHDPR